MKRRVSLYLQRPPRVCWCLRISIQEDDGAWVTLKTWFDEYTEEGKPPPYSLVLPMTEKLTALGKRAMELDV